MVAFYVEGVVSLHTTTELASELQRHPNLDTGARLHLTGSKTLVIRTYENCSKGRKNKITFIIL